MGGRRPLVGEIRPFGQNRRKTSLRLESRPPAAKAKERKKKQKIENTPNWNLGSSSSRPRPLVG